jgi:hypothetical protein
VHLISMKYSHKYINLEGVQGGQLTNISIYKVNRASETVHINEKQLLTTGHDFYQSSAVSILGFIFFFL